MSRERLDQLKKKYLTYVGYTENRIIEVKYTDLSDLIERVQESEDKYEFGTVQMETLIRDRNRILEENARLREENKKLRDIENAKIRLVNHGMNEEWYALQEQNIAYCKVLEEIAGETFLGGDSKNATEEKLIRVILKARRALEVGHERD